MELAINKTDQTGVTREEASVASYDDGAGEKKKDRKKERRDEGKSFPTDFDKACPSGRVVYYFGGRLLD